MASERGEVVAGVRLQVGIPNPGEMNIPDVIIEFIDEHKASFEMDEVARLMRLAIVQGWAAAFDYMHTSTGIWRANAVAHAEHIPGASLEMSRPSKPSEIEAERKVKVGRVDQGISMNEGIVQARFRSAFPDHPWTTKPRSRYTRLQYWTRASIYFRDGENGNIARINLGFVGNFPSELQHFLGTQNVPKDGRDYLIGTEHMDRVIALLRNNS